MSRIGRMPVAVPAGVEITVAEGNLVTVKGPKGMPKMSKGSNTKLNTTPAI